MKKQRLKKIGFIFLIITIIISGIVLYARFVATTGLIVKEYKITDSHLPDSFHGLKIVHISDIHYGQTINKKEFEAMVNKINMIKPDIVVLTGDLLDDDIKNYDEETKKIISDGLKKIKVSINKYAIAGNHDDFYNDWENIIEDGEFINLNDNFELVYYNSYEPIMIAGLQTNLHDNILNERMIPINEYLESLKDNTDEEEKVIPKYKIMIMHEPDYIEKFNYQDYNLILAGHSHNGQVRIPFVGAVILPLGAKKYYEPYYQLGNTHLYISSGTGTSTLKLRLFYRPSINLYRLTNK